MSLIVCAVQVTFADWDVQLRPGRISCKGQQAKLNEDTDEFISVTPEREIIFQSVGIQNENGYKITTSYTLDGITNTIKPDEISTGMGAMQSINFSHVAKLGSKEIFALYSDEYAPGVFTDLAKGGHPQKERQFHGVIWFDGYKGTSFTVNCKATFFPYCEGQYDGGVCMKIRGTSNFEKEKNTLNGYVCKKIVDCMPSDNTDNLIYCTDEYFTWAKKNCSTQPFMVQ